MSVVIINKHFKIVFSRFIVGIGVGMFIVSGIVGIYYNMIIGWALYYLFATLISIPTGKLPWDRCDKEWSSLRE